MRRDPLQIVLVVLLVIGIVLSVDVGLARIRLEEANRRVELAVEYGEVKRLARWSGLAPEEMLHELAARGVTGVLFKEENLSQLETLDIAVLSGEALLAKYGWEREEVPWLRPQGIYVATQSETAYRRLAGQLPHKAPGFQEFRHEGVHVFTSTLGAAELRALGLGFDPDGIQGARRAGLNILLQVMDWPQATPKGVRAVMEQALATEGLSALLFNDAALPGYPGQQEVLLYTLQQSDVPIGIIEFFPQQGLKDLVVNLEKRAVRVHAIGEQEMTKLTPERAVDRLCLAASERNCRILLTRFFFRPEVDDWKTHNLDYVAAVARGLTREGFTLGRAEPFGALPVSKMNLLWIGLAVVAGGVMLLSRVLSRRWAVWLGLLGAVAWVGLLAVGLVGPGRLLMALAATVIFPSLSLVTFLRPQPAGLGESMGLLVKTSLFSLVGAVLMVGLLADVSFMLKLDQFRGVKIAHVLPLVVVVLFCWYREEGKNWLKSLKDLWEAKISVGWTAVAAVLALALVIYVSRTGNESAAVSGFELQVRSLLDRLLVVRPRTKEFLVGHPALLLLFSLGYRHRYLPVLILGAIGQVSLVNTFAHIHTPVLISLFRAFNGLWLGLLLGVLAVAGCRWLARLGERVHHG
ncbi:MAG TPA: hypothetical protein GX504_11525 [Clostridia bacterium]|nr:hypothetical protein [Clostridia bacterium]